ncbi:ferredoxin [Thermobifida halotolerans]|uniref:ferredoxin n=1 Tax=Thermobifida halotolerans TaxID=483545 RepID=UPI001F237A38|nr:ferredoxin [Thermobifida halotolerans]
MTPAPDGERPLRLRADAGTCAGAGQCARVAPDLFDQDGDGLVVLLRAEARGPARERALLTADLCPSGALRVHGSA